ncbi:hypothetical protein B0H63DRAFT_444880 [Podospora didyma]|uniref:BHLH domain-containing protein n=1 Tax=Podospora didyma TaxID=330526 RepID=A0AAE0P841_9PEZI|nr:hypothetical protein B0H63DRAFT_444880 [Podospora didyma]
MPPRSRLPPTPASSTDIQGEDGSKMATLQLSFELPPPAITPHGSTSGSTASTSSTATSRTTQASETVKTRRRSSAAPMPPKDQFALPPPPTRSRKIIQMRPQPVTETPASKAAPAAAPAATPSTGSKRKQPSATSAAGRKIARKTAHSLIERRRRSKMNDEFAVLKNMIPACSGEMHKLAILQASIEYVRYLEDCVAQLKAQQGPGSGSDVAAFTTSFIAEEGYPEDADSPDVEMTEVPSPELTPQPGRSQQQSISPALLLQDSRNRHGSTSSASTDYQNHHGGYSTSATTSPAFGPQAHGYAQSIHSATSGSNLTSPALPPQRDPDQEATAALLMLNQMDRRGTVASSSSSSSSSSSAPGRGMSVKELLST